MSKYEPTDGDLNDLLDSALDDFEKVAKSETGQATGTGTGTGTENGTTSNPNADEANEFFIEQTKLFGKRMNELLGGEAEGTTENVLPLPQDADVLMDGFKKMAEAAALTISGENTASDEDISKFSETISQTLKGLQEGTQTLESNVTESDITNMFDSLNLENSEGAETNTFLPFMEGMMQSLLSAEMLLPSINDLLEKYPKYLEENVEKLSEEDQARYKKQYDLYKSIKEDLENEVPGDSPSVKRQKFHSVLSKMNKLQEFGQPPNEILADATGDLPFGEANFMSNGPQCPTM